MTRGSGRGNRQAVPSSDAASPGDGFPAAAFFGFPDVPALLRRAGRRAGRGDVRAAVLSLLGEAPANGYGLIQEIERRTHGAWRPSSGSVYPTLQQLVDEGLVAPNGDGRSTEYQLTDLGRAYLADHGDELDETWRDAPRLSEGERALFRSAGRLMSAAFQFRFATDAQRDAAIERLDETRRELYRILAD